MQATISLLPVSLSLVHVPRRRLPALAQQVLRQVLHPHPAFLNITSNDIELSIFAEHHILNDFQPIAHKDARRNRSEPVEISYDNWSVLQIDSHSDQLDNSGTRVHDLSAPLAAAGISILYQSSYMSDFIFVKESRLKEAMDLFEAAGFHLYHSSSDDEYEEPPSPANYYTPSTDGPVSPSSHAHTHSSTTKRGAVLTRDDTQNQNNPSKKSADESTTSPTAGTAASRHASPTSAEVRILPPDLACVGLSDEFGVDHWGLKIVKLVAFPDLIGPQSTTPSSSSTKSVPATYSRSRSPSSSSYASSSSSSDYASCDSVSSSASVFEDEDRYFDESPRDRDTDSTSFTSLATTNNEQDTDNASALVKGTGPSAGNAKVRVAGLAPLSPIVPLNAKVQVDRPRISVHTNGNADASSSRKSHRRRRHRETAETASAETKSAKASKRSTSSSSSTGTPFFGFTRTPEGSSLTAPTRVLAALFPPEERHMLICGSELDAADKWVERQTRRAMDGVYSDADEEEEEDREDEQEYEGQEEDEEDDRDGRDMDVDEGREEQEAEEEEGGDFLGLSRGHGHRYRSRGASTHRSSQRSSWESRSRGRGGGRRSRSLHGGGAGAALKCLQVDLRRFGLDKHGLVNRFSRVLEENEINHMYSSTFKTANLLVDKRDALRAQALLRSC
ncbi:hypothetical protein D9619_000617 [Psilocybe cf. subviscida]|uniref:CASTOR ACT domain-containing protein n=1 Tax=Psilocybe cf. subviscida TaxID=2480587 RepID=A0A8H5BE48_9AGAR|nr:hypothetical protein D9619_000617 [Psilocybe cf. subviscida]